MSSNTFENKNITFHIVSFKWAPYIAYKSKMDFVSFSFNKFTLFLVLYISTKLIDQYIVDTLTIVKVKWMISK